MSLIYGIALGAGLCASLGPQSAFVLRQGIRGEAVLGVATVCTLADFLLIGAAVAGADAVVAHLPEAERIGAWGGAIFVLVYGCLTLAMAARPQAHVQPLPDTDARHAPAVTAALALSLLNPQVYLEMVVLVGGVALLFQPVDRLTFALGVALVSPIWFFGIALGGRRLAGLFARPRALTALDVGTGLVMLALAATIIRGELERP